MPTFQQLQVVRMTDMYDMKILLVYCGSIEMYIYRVCMHLDFLQQVIMPLGSGHQNL
jgi:hypothetical protein